MKNYVLEMATSGQRMIPIESFAKDAETIKILSPRVDTKELAGYWLDKEFNVSYQDITDRGYDYLRAAGLKIEKPEERGQKTTICSETIWFRAKGWSGENKGIAAPEEIFKGVKLDNVITPVDYFSARKTWDEDRVEEYRRKNAQ